MASRTATDLVHPDRDDIRFTAVMAAFGDPVRLAIVARLADAEGDGQLACTTFALPVSKSTQSGHFRVLREAGVIRQRDEGTRRLNSLRRGDLDARFPGLLDLAVPEGRAIMAEWASARPSASR
ncbi:helix-turn-helix domain-containing protein [Amycolatopsis cynarae]|uniref:Helix-turn-helix domain-containing protein n=1 Tax=Amycolatopsis cynarae TaxID=2995223 RepID=A0ABY7B9U1_9PSEU|nr:helix-turn-helix domain-containing protein [Amycolatopsis sp. HUAS 11-8]WAL69137.1 helix-turn-helix domain-containing protein [Amycolatopsis sp. HUAS 11-8]